MRQEIKENLIGMIFYQIFAILIFICGILIWTSNTADLWEKICFTILFVVHITFFIYGIIITAKEILDKVERNNG